MNTRQKEESLTLEILENIARKDDLTQRHLAADLGVALGMANSYLKRCVRKGLVKIQQAPANRYLYYLTPKGFAEKSRLTAEFLSASFGFYRRASLSCSEVFQRCRERNHKKIVLCGLSELAEIASLCAQKHEIEIVGYLERGTETKKFLGLPVYASLDALSDFDACVITDVKDPHVLLEYLESRLTREKIFIPDILGIGTKENLNESVPGNHQTGERDRNES